MVEEHRDSTVGGVSRGLKELKNTVSSVRSMQIVTRKRTRKEFARKKTAFVSLNPMNPLLAAEAAECCKA